MKVIGKGKYSGEYQGTKYEKLFYSVETTPPKKFANFQGKYVETIVCPAIIENDIANIGDEINVYYNKYGKVDAIFVVNNKEK